MNIYRKSKLKVTMLITCCLLIMILGVGWMLYLFVHSKFSSFGIIVSCIISFIILVMRIKPQYLQMLEISDKIVFHDEMKTYVNFDEVKTLSYSGTWLVPMSEMMTIRSKSNIIYVDFNFQNYRHVWKMVITVCKENNPEIEIDPKLLKRVGSLS